MGICDGEFILEKECEILITVIDLISIRCSVWLMNPTEIVFTEKFPALFKQHILRQSKI